MGKARKMSQEIEQRFGQQYLKSQLTAGVGAHRLIKPYPVSMQGIGTGAGSHPLMQIQRQPFMMGGMQPPAIGPSIFRGTYVSTMHGGDQK